MKTILITGGTSGIGKALVEHFSSLDYQVYFTARNEQKAKNLVAQLPNTNYWLMDFSQFSSVVEAAQQIKTVLPTLDVLINNAGTWQMEFGLTADGIERNFAVNHLAPMLLTLELLPIIHKAPAGRIINTSSGAHRRNILDFDDLEFRQKRYDGVLSYSQSKLCNLLFSLQLNRYLSDSDSSISVHTVHPGYVQSSLFDNMTPRSWDNVPDASHGARSAIYAATSPDLEGESGAYIYLEHQEEQLSSLAKDPQLAAQLWDISFNYLKSHLSQAALSASSL